MVVRQAHTRTPSEAVTRSLAVPAPPQPSRPHDIDIPLATSNNAVVSFRPADVWNLTLTVEHPANDLTHIGLHVATALATAGWSVHAITGTRLTPRDVAFPDTAVQTPAGAARLISALVSEAVLRQSDSDMDHPPVCLFITSTELIDWPVRASAATHPMCRLTQPTSAESNLRTLMHVGPKVGVHVVLMEHCVGARAASSTLRLFPVPGLYVVAGEYGTCASMFRVLEPDPDAPWTGSDYDEEPYGAIEWLEEMC